MALIKKDLGVENYEIPLGVKEISLSWEEIWVILTPEEKMTIAAAVLSEGDFQMKLIEVMQRMEEIKREPLVIDGDPAVI